MKPISTGLSRRALIAGFGTVALSGTAGLAVVAAQQQPASPPPAAPADPSKVLGARATPVGARSPFEQPARLAAGVQNSSARAPIDTLRGIVTPSDLHY